MKHPMWRLLAAVSAALCTVGVAHAQAAKPVPRTVDRVVAVVNDEVITANELVGRLRVADEQLKRQNIKPPTRDVLTRQVLEQMIVQRAQLQLARESGVRVDDGTVNAAIARIAEDCGIQSLAVHGRTRQDFYTGLAEYDIALAGG